VVVVVVGRGVGGGGLKIDTLSRTGLGSCCGLLNMGASIFMKGISWLAVSAFPVTPVRSRGPNVVKRDEMSGPLGLDGLDCGITSRTGGGRGREGGGGVLSFDGSL